MRDFKRLTVWQKAHQLTLFIYRVTETFPKDELYGLTSQMRRCAASIPANIAEGCGRNGNKELNYFCQVAMGSASELEYHILLARDLKLVTEDDYNAVAALVIEVKKMLYSLIQKLKAES